ncbi:MAG: CoB--CoM heterodisulfide reductase iron-sulfur subunit B family protein [Clostridia bacterium]|nr:CoB--CoM heterodisulfide reductase iron-sulfur subunit B family protein [Clostridia bacterium]
MYVSYFPGCTLKTKAVRLDRCARKSAEILGIELQELDSWQCCGGAFTSAADEVATKLSSVRALAEAERLGRPLVSVCSACYNVLKQTDHAFKTDPEFASKVRRYLAPDECYNGGTEVLHLLELLRDKVGFENIAKKVVNPLKGVKIAAYYGCMLLRPSDVLGLDDPENPSVMEELIRALGGEAVGWSQRNECCGGYVLLESPELAKKRSLEISSDAAAAGADMIVTACPLCRYNLDKAGSGLPTVYFTELLAKALGAEVDEI